MPLSVTCGSPVCRSSVIERDWLTTSVCPQSFDNSSLVEVDKISRNDVEKIILPFNEFATEMGNSKFANMIALGSYLGRKPVVKMSSIEQTLKSAFAGKKPELVSLNLKAIEKGILLVGVRA